MRSRASRCRATITLRSRNTSRPSTNDERHARYGGARRLCRAAPSVGGCGGPCRGPPRRSMSVPAAGREVFFTSDFLAQLERLTLASRRAFRGRSRGERRSPRKGHSVEFCDYRAYGVGDDLRYVDWNVFGRLDRLHVNLFVDEEDLCLHLLVDGSRSMDFGRPTKLAYAIRLAAALGFVGLVNLERVGVAVVRERLSEGWPPTRGRSQFPALLDFLGGIRSAGATGLNDGLGHYAMRAREPGVAVLISD